MFFRGLKLTAIFAQLGRNKIEIEGAIKFSFIPHARNLLCRSFPFRFWIRGERRESVFVQGPAAFEGAVTHLDVMLFAPGEIIERERILSRANHAQIALNAGTK